MNTSITAMKKVAYGITMHKIISIEFTLKKNYRNQDKIWGKTMSWLEMSFENRFSTRPTGLESKNYTFALTILDNIFFNKADDCMIIMSIKIELCNNRIRR